MKKTGFVPVKKSTFLQLGTDVFENDAEVDNGSTRTEKKKLREALVKKYKVDEARNNYIDIAADGAAALLNAYAAFVDMDQLTNDPNVQEQIRK